MNQGAGINVMLRWLLLSSVLHAFALLFFIDFLPSTVTSSPQGQLAAIQAVLQQKQDIQAPESVVATGEVAKPKHSLPRMPISMPNANRPGVEATPSVVEEAVTTTSASTQVAADSTVPIGESRAKPVEVVSQDGLREYRLNLSREARRYKRYPALARQRGLEGVVVVVVSTRAGLALPQVTLSRSSGQEVLDQQAMEMLGLAVRAASLPDSLRGRDFAIDLPVHFSLDE